MEKPVHERNIAMFWKNLRLNWKIGVIVGVLLCIILAISVMSLHNLGTVDLERQKIESAANLNALVLARKTDHWIWLAALQRYVYDDSVKTLAVHEDPRQCGFGKWYYGSQRSEAEEFSPAIAEPLRLIEEAHSALHASASAIKDAKAAGNVEEARATFENESLRNIQTVQKLLSQISTIMDEDEAKSNLAFEQHVSKMFKHTTGFVSFAVLLAICMSMLLALSVTEPVLRIARYVASVSEGALDAPFIMARKDELGQLADNLKGMVASMTSLIHEAERQRIAAEDANKAKSSFLSSMSHEIRTPLNAILGVTELQLHDKTLEPNRREAFGMIYNSGGLLRRLINDILDMSKIEARKLELAPAAYEVASLINDTVQLNMMRSGSKPLEFELHVDENIPAVLVGDMLRVKQILNNLLSNAFKYTENGLVKLSLVHETEQGSDLLQHEWSALEAGKNAPDVTLIFTVSDTGQGMSAEQLSKLFDEYARFHQDAKCTIEGVGLGMPITRRLVDLMNGEMLVESELGKGSTFTVRLPQGNAGAGALGREAAEQLRQFHINSSTHMESTQIMREPMPYGSVLVVDDVEMNIYVAEGVLALYDLTIDSAESGLTAIEKIKQGKEYDVVFMDHMMPGMDGIEALEAIRALGYTRPVVALTANAMIGQAAMFREKGFDDFIAKPIDLRQLDVILHKFVRDMHPPAVVEAARWQIHSAPGQSADARLGFASSG